MVGNVTSLAFLKATGPMALCFAVEKEFFVR
jgi:hypothetical protein